MTLTEAKSLNYGDMVYSKHYKNADGTPQRFRINGKVHTWKRNSNRVKVPIRRGLWENGYLTEENIERFYI